MKRKMVHILLAGKEADSFAAFNRELGKDQRLQVFQVDSAEQARRTIADGAIDVVVVAEELRDKESLQFIREIVADKPFITCALVSPLYPQEFHEQTEGLGLFMQLPVHPGAGAAKEMLALLEKLNQLHKP